MGRPAQEWTYNPLLTFSRNDIRVTGQAEEHLESPLGLPVRRPTCRRNALQGGQHDSALRAHELHQRLTFLALYHVAAKEILGLQNARRESVSISCSSVQGQAPCKHFSSDDAEKQHKQGQMVHPYPRAFACCATRKRKLQKDKQCPSSACMCRGTLCSLIFQSSPAASITITQCSKYRQTWPGLGPRLCPGRSVASHVAGGPACLRKRF